jgi:dienelactone hydrolase
LGSLLAANLGAAQELPIDCDGPAGDPDPATDPNGYRQRDLVNMACSLQRIQDEYTNPAFFLKFEADETPRTYSANVLDQLREPTRPRITLAQWIPGGTTADPYRVPADWEAAGRGRVEDVSFIAADGAELVGRIFTPNPTDPPSRLPAIVITTGSIQGYQELYNWAAEGLAEAGYMVLVYDVQGQGRSETLPHHTDGSPSCDASGCQGVPFQQNYNFYQGTRDALDFLKSTPSQPYAHAVGANAAGTDSFNPLHGELDPARIGVAGHSLGAAAVSVVGQSYPALSAIVAWDALGAVPKDAGGNLVDELGNRVTLRVPALSVTAEYFFNPEPADPSNPPDPTNKSAAFAQLSSAGVDTMLVQLRSSTHLEFSYVPYILPASRHGERVTMYYTLAWFDRFLKGDTNATNRLTALDFDDSADRSSIGGGTFDPQRIQPGVKGADGNVPYRIGGDCVANRLSIYYTSKYFLPRDGESAADMRALGCPS